MTDFSKFAILSSQRDIAREGKEALVKRYGNHDAADADAIIALGGDGFMLETFRRYMPLLRRGLPIYGMNCGTIGFLMNAYSEDDLPARLAAAKAATLHPLRMSTLARGGQFEELAFNEVSLFRQTRQAAHIKITIDGRERLERLISDGVLVSTPAGSTAYNLSAHGPVIPLGADILALTPISAFRPRRWRGALLKSDAVVKFENLDTRKRPLSAVADSQEIRDVKSVTVSQDLSVAITLLYDENQSLDEKILHEQFAT